MAISDDLKEKQTQLVAEALEHRQTDTCVEAEIEMVELVVFMLNGDYYAIESRNVREILPYSPITSIPGCPDTIHGVFNVRGDIESVLSLHRLLGLNMSELATQSRILLARCEAICSGILVDSVEDVLRIESDLIKPPLTTLNPSIKSFAVGGETFYHEHYVTILDVKRIFQAMT